MKDKIYEEGVKNLRTCERKIWETPVEEIRECDPVHSAPFYSFLTLITGASYLFFTEKCKTSTSFQS
jgi:hypothetical protein